MRAVVQRVFSAHVEVEGEVVGAIDHGLVAFIGAGKGDSDADVVAMADKIVGLRVFEDDAGKMSKNVADVGGGILAVSQFTVFGDMRRGRRPSFDDAMPPDDARVLFDRAVERMMASGVPVRTGVFRAMMRVLVDNDGPVTILIDTRKVF